MEGKTEGEKNRSGTDEKRLNFGRLTYNSLRQEQEKMKESSSEKEEIEKEVTENSERVRRRETDSK